MQKRVYLYRLWIYDKYMFCWIDFLISKGVIFFFRNTVDSKDFKFRWYYKYMTNLKKFPYINDKKCWFLIKMTVRKWVILLLSCITKTVLLISMNDIHQWLPFGFVTQLESKASDCEISLKHYVTEKEILYCNFDTKRAKSGCSSLKWVL